MDGPDGASSSKTYRFVSDPRHKETLSGRVHAACITCRRKKIKCDGQVPCQTCREKGLVCEGQMQRKRPSKPLDQPQPSDISGRMSLDLSTPPSLTTRNKASQPGTSRPRPDAVGNPIAIPQRPSANLERTNTLHSESSYSSGKQSVPNESSISEESCQDLPTPAPATYDCPTKPSYFSIAPLNWTFPAGENVHAYPQPTHSPNAHDLLIAPVHDDSLDWQKNKPPLSWLPDPSCVCDPSQLLRAASALEAHARSLRLLASRQSVDAVLNDARRSTVTFPLPSEMVNTFPEASMYPRGAYDDLTLVMDRLSGANNDFTPETADGDLWSGIGYDD